jgi:hypothetical protein
MLSPTGDPRHVELLAMVANLHADVRYRLKIGSTVNIGRPWMEGSAADHLLVSLHYPYGPVLERCELDERHLRFSWQVPFTDAEANLLRSQGMETLERLLEVLLARGWNSPQLPSSGQRRIASDSWRPGEQVAPELRSFGRR